MNWDSVLEHALAAIPPTIIAFAAWRSSRGVHTIVNSQRTDMLSQIDELKGEVQRLHHTVNGHDRDG
jgi:hypothetical protein